MMPVYQFVCKKHGQFEKITIRAEWDDIRCPKCGVKSEVDRKNAFAGKTHLEKYLISPCSAKYERNGAAS
jgi:putative FmdB family regulatory protein